MHFKKITKNDFDLKITLKPSVRCDQQCWFCSEYNNHEKDWTLDDMYKVIDKIKELNTNQRIFIYLYGGEPLLFKNWNILILELLKIPNIKIQIQTNLSIKLSDLKSFYENGFDRERLEFCSSYHLGKQKVNHFLEKLKFLESVDGLGYCFFNTDVCDESKFRREFKMVKNLIPNKLKVRFTEAQNNFPDNYPVEARQYNDKNYDYVKYNNDKLFDGCLEDEFTFDVNNKVKNFTEVLSSKDNAFKLWKCECSMYNIVIDNNLKVYKCNDDYSNNHYNIDIDELNKNYFKIGYCMNKYCYDGLEFKKWK